jgi:hypothetical protein
MRPTLKVIRGGKEIGDSVDRTPRGEPEHFTRCQTCGLMFDTRDLGQMLEHDGPLPICPIVLGCLAISRSAYPRAAAGDVRCWLLSAEHTAGRMRQTRNP